MVQYYEKRADVRNIHKSPITVEDLKAGKTYRARMVNYCRNGLYFETDWHLKSGAEICILMENSPKVSSSPSLKDRYRAEIMWHTKLGDSLYTYGYGVKYISDSDKKNLQRGELKDTKNDNKELRRHPRRSYPKTVFFMSQSQYYEGLANNISKGGIFIETKDKFSVGQIIKLVIPGTKIDKNVMLKGEIIHVNQRGVGVKFKSLLKKRKATLNPRIQKDHST
jgi:Tfp pilus assembly protein PilZ